jgi:hypothetical protein
LLDPAWRPIWAFLPWRICSSVKFLLFSVAILGPIMGPVYSGCFCVVRPSENRHSVTCNHFAIGTTREKPEARRPVLVGVLSNIVGGKGWEGIICTVMEAANGFVVPRALAGAARLLAMVNNSC